jgi:archaellum component FlaF (FlaF/FlaG flagellin family)
MKKNLLILSVFIAALTSCGGGKKKVLVMSTGGAKIDKDAASVTVSGAGNSYEEQIVEFSAKSVNLKVQSPSGNVELPLSENGLYILNTMKDTVVGGYVKFSPAKTTQDTIKQEQVKQQIDSIQLLIEGKNISEANRNFYILPNHAVKITNNTNAYVIGPFHQITTLQQEGNKEPEVYRFNTLGEMREMLERLKKLTVASTEAN